MEDGGGGGSGEGGPAACGRTSTAFARPRVGGAGGSAVPAGLAPTARSRTRGRRPAPSPPPAPSPAASSRSPSPFPPRVGDVKIPRKSRVVAPRAEARFRRPAAPSPGRLGRRGAGRGRSFSSPRQGPADAARQTPSAPNRVGKFTFMKLMRFQSYFRPREACPTAESDRKRGEVRVFSLFFFFPKRGERDARWANRRQAQPCLPRAQRMCRPGAQPRSELQRRQGAGRPDWAPSRTPSARGRGGWGAAARGPPEAYSHLQLPCPGFGETPVSSFRTTHPPSPLLSSYRPFPLLLSHIFFLIFSYSLLILPPTPTPQFIFLYFLPFLPGIPEARS